jgi:hypothetical protein
VSDATRPDQRDDLDEDVALADAAAVPEDEDERRASTGGPGIGAMGVTTNVEDPDTVPTDEERNP